MNKTMKTNTKNAGAAKTAISTEELIQSLLGRIGQVEAQITAVAFKATWAGLSAAGKAEMLMGELSAEGGVVLGNEDPRTELLRAWAGEAKELNAKQSAEKGRTRPAWVYEVKDNSCTFLRLSGRNRKLVTVVKNDGTIAATASDYVEPGTTAAKDDAPF